MEQQSNGVGRKNKVKVIYAGSSSKHHDPSDSPYAMTKYLVKRYVNSIKNHS